MATSKKKKRRSPTTSTARPQPAAAMSPGEQPPKDASVPAAVEAPDVSTPEEDDAQFKAEYSYVRKDLRNLAVISLVLFAVMFVIGSLV
jgi:hypothetical protein